MSNTKMKKDLVMKRGNATVKKLTVQVIQGALLAMMSGTVVAQVAPDAGVLLQENLPAPAMPAPAPALPGAAGVPSGQEVPGGRKIQLQSVDVDEVAGIDHAQLLKATGLDQVQGQEYDLAGLRALANSVTAYLQGKGLSLARAWLPEQTLDDGKLRIRILPGQYGGVTVTGTDRALTENAQKWLSGIHHGDQIRQDKLHRSLLLLSELSGVKAGGVLKPGGATGEADLEVAVERQKSFKATVGADNYGNRYAGRNRVSASVEGSPGLVLGDYLSATALRSSLGMWQAGANYSLPVGYDGWRLQTQLSRSSYELGNDFASLGAYGTADTVLAGVSYPLVMAQRTNVKLSASWMWRRLEDVKAAAGSRDGKHTRGTVVSLSANHQDSTGVTWGTLGWNAGKLSLGDVQARGDALTAQSAGTYHKFNLDLGRLQRVSQSLNLYGRLSGQWANKNLDSSDKFVLGGANGVRAWPSGEAVGDTGWLGQIELRYQINEQWQPYVFADAGVIKVNRQPWRVVNNRYYIAGKGLGVRFTAAGLKVDVAVARRHGDKAPESEPRADKTRVWVNATYQF